VAVITSVSATTIALFTLLVLGGAPIDGRMGYFFVFGNVAVVPMAALFAGLVAIGGKVWKPEIRFWPGFLQAFAFCYVSVVVIALIWVCAWYE
jgi:hypothetical protein